MRTRSALLVASCVLAASVVTGGALNESVGADKGIPPNHPQLTKFSKVSDIVMDKCMACHSRNYDLPFYAKIPGIKEIIEKDFNDGLRAMDLNLELVEAAKEADRRSDACQDGMGYRQRNHAAREVYRRALGQPCVV